MDSGQCSDIPLGSHPRSYNIRPYPGTSYSVVAHLSFLPTLLFSNLYNYLQIPSDFVNNYRIFTKSEEYPVGFPVYTQRFYWRIAQKKQETVSDFLRVMPPAAAVFDFEKASLSLFFP